MSARRIATTGLVVLVAVASPVTATAVADGGSTAGRPPALSGPIVRGTFVSRTESGIKRGALPYTGYADWLLAVLGLGLTATGIGMRRRLG